MGNMGFSLDLTHGKMLFLFWQSCQNREVKDQLNEFSSKGKCNFLMIAEEALDQFGM